MPIYEYRCRACGDTFDRLRTLSEADEPTSCDCGATDSARLPSRIARRASSATLPMAGGSTAPMGGGGGCCGGACGCG